jgi:hypothetical protein
LYAVPIRDRATQLGIDGEGDMVRGSHETPCWMEVDSNLYGAFPVK